jgi:hypothetical protein
MRPYVDSLKNVIHGQQLDLGNPNGLDDILLFNKPS